MRKGGYWSVRLQPDQKELRACAAYLVCLKSNDL